MQCHELLTYLNKLLQPEKFQDYCPNGLQVQGKAIVHKIVSGVTASQAFIDQVIARQADVLLVHHGYFWRGEDPCITGIKQKRLGHVLKHNMNLIAYHLPLDAHPVYGNNAQLARVLGFSDFTVLADASMPSSTQGLIFTTELAHAYAPPDLVQQITTKLNRAPLHIAASNRPIQKLAWCTGAAQDFIELVAQNGFDAYISGEVSERTFHMAKEYNIHYFACGHHATERYGIQALGEHLMKKFKLDCEFVDIDNPV